MIFVRFRFPSWERCGSVVCLLIFFCFLFITESGRQVHHLNHQHVRNHTPSPSYAVGFLFVSVSDSSVDRSFFFILPSIDSRFVCLRWLTRPVFFLVSAFASTAAGAPPQPPPEPSTTTATTAACRLLFSRTYIHRIGRLEFHQLLLNGFPALNGVVISWY